MKHPRTSIRRPRRRPPGSSLRGAAAAVLWGAAFWIPLVPAGPAAAGEADGGLRVTSSQSLDSGASVRPVTLADLRLEEGALQLTLDEALELALEHGVDLRVERYRHQGQLLGIRQSRGIFDLRLGGNVGFDEDTRPTGSTLEAADVLVTEGQRFGFSLSQLSVLGGTGQLRFDTSRSESSDLRIDPNPVFNLGTDFSYSQPLLRGFGRRVTRRDLVVARTNAAISLEDFQTRVETILVQTANAYWNLVEQREQLQVAEESLGYAEELHELNRKKLEAGILAPIEMAQSEATVAARRIDIIELRSQVGNAADELRRILHLEPGDAWDFEIVPVFEPAVDHRPVDLDRALAAALAKRPDLRQQRYRNEIQELEARVARNRKLPQLDVTASFRLNAREGDRFLRDDDGVPILDDDGGFIIVPGGFEDALSQLADRDFNGWSVDFRWAYALQNREAKVAETIARIAVEEGRLALRSLELEVRTEVRRNVRELEAAALRIESARIARDLAEKNLEAIRLGYQHGSKSTLDVNDVEEALSERRSGEINAILAYRRTELAFQRSIGELLERRGIVLAEE